MSFYDENKLGVEGAEFVFHLRRFIEEAARLRERVARGQLEEDNDWEYYQLDVASAATSTLDDSGLLEAAASFLPLFYDRCALTSISSLHDHDYQLAAAPPRSVLLCGEIDMGPQERVRHVLPDGSHDWRELPTSLGGPGLDILISFGVSLAASAVYEFIKKARENDLAPRIDSQVAVDICEHEMRSSAGYGDVRIGRSLCTPSNISHVKFEVFLFQEPQGLQFHYLVREDGTICGRHVSHLDESDEPTDA